MVTVDSTVPKKTLTQINKRRGWDYGYNKEYDIVIISKDGTLGDVVEISGLRIGLPSVPDSVWARSNKKEEQYWERQDIPNELEKIQSIIPMEIEP